MCGLWSLLLLSIKSKFKVWWITTMSWKGKRRNWTISPTFPHLACQKIISRGLYSFITSNLNYDIYHKCNKKFKYDLTDCNFSVKCSCLFFLCFLSWQTAAVKGERESSYVVNWYIVILDTYLRCCSLFGNEYWVI